MLHRWLVVFLSSLLSATAIAQSFDQNDAGGTTQEVPPLPEEADKLPSAEPEDVSAAEDLPSRNASVVEPDKGQWVFSGAVGAGSDFVSAQGTVGYYWVRYFGLEASYYYYQINTSGASGSQYGPEVDAIARYYNSTMLVPFVGAGPGYTTWHRRFEGVSFSDGSSLTGNALYGIDLALTPHFGIEVMRKYSTFFSNPPLSFNDRTQHEAKSAWTTHVGFRLLF